MQTITPAQGTYAVVDVERIHDFILEVGRLRDMRGASELLVRIEEADLPQLIADHQGCKVYAAGGITLARFPDENQAGEFSIAVRELYWQKTGGAVSVAIAVSPRTGNPLADHHERQRRLRLAKEERRAEGSPPGAYPAFGSTHLPQFKLCTRCGVRAALKIVWDPAERRDEFLCAPCEQRTSLGRRAGRQGLPVEKGSWETLEKEWGCVIEAPDQFADFGRKAWRSRRSRESSFMALLVADGNGLGDYIDSLLTKWAAEKKSADEIEDQLGGFSMSLEKVLKQAWTEAVRKVYGGPRWQNRLKDNGTFHLPQRMLLCGGDDLLAVVEASRALELAHAFVGAFEAGAEGSRQDLGTEPGKPLTISVAVVLGKVGYPFMHFYDRAHTLLGTAKRWGRHGRSARPSQRSPSQVHVGVIRSSAPGEQEQTERPLDIPGMRPFFLDELRRLLDQGLAWAGRREVPRNKLKGLVDALREDWADYDSIGGAEPPWRAYGLWRSHLREKERSSFDNMVKRLTNTAFAYPWLKRGAGADPHQWVTPLADFLELMDFWGE